jgi:hypothetical protein
LVFQTDQTKKITEKEWVQTRLGRRQFLLYAVLRRLYRILPTLADLSLWNALLGLLKLALNAAIIFLPLMFAKFLAPDLGIPPAKVAELTSYAVYQTGALALLQVSRYLLEAVSKRDKDAKERLERLYEISVALGQAIGVISTQIEAYAATDLAAAQRDLFLTQALKCIEATVRLTMGKMDERYCCVTLLTFERGGQVMTRARSSVTGRRIGGMSPEAATIAWSVAKYSDQYMTIQHFKKTAKVNKENNLPYRALSVNERPPYESILAFPLPPVADTEQNRIRKGVVTIDSALPYEFLGEDVVILPRVQAYLDLINLMLTNHSTGVEPEV